MIRVLAFILLLAQGTLGSTRAQSEIVTGATLCNDEGQNTTMELLATMQQQSEDQVKLLQKMSHTMQKMITEMQEVKDEVKNEMQKIKDEVLSEIQEIKNHSFPEAEIQNGMSEIQSQLEKMLPSDCEQRTGIVQIKPVTMETPIQVYCDQGWIVIQRRVDGSVNFTRSWQEYKEGFGDILNNYWLGLESLNKLTVIGDVVLRVELKDFDEEMRFAEYDNMHVYSEDVGYRLRIGEYTGNARDSLSIQNGCKFSTYDVDNDGSTRDCASMFQSGGWFYEHCFRANLNGVYYEKNEEREYGHGIIWVDWGGYAYSFKSAGMKIKYKRL